MADGLPQDQVGPRPNVGSLSSSQKNTGAGRVLSVSPREVVLRNHPPPVGLMSSTPVACAAAPLTAERTERAAEHATLPSAATELKMTSAIATMHEHLEVGSQMLQAFEVQLGRIESALAELKAQERRAQVAEERLQQRLADVECRTEAALHRFSTALNELTNDAIARAVAPLSAAASSSSNDPPQKMAQDLAQLSVALHHLAERLAVEDASVPTLPAVEIAPLKFQKWASA